MIDCGGCCGSALQDRCGRSETPRADGPPRRKSHQRVEGTSADSSGPDRSGPPERRAAARKPPHLEPPPPAFRLAAACSGKKEEGDYCRFWKRSPVIPRYAPKAALPIVSRRPSPARISPAIAIPLRELRKDSAPRMMPTTETGNPHSGKNQAHRLAIPRISEPMANPLRLGDVDCGCMNLLLKAVSPTRPR